MEFALKNNLDNVIWCITFCYSKWLGSQGIMNMVFCLRINKIIKATRRRGRASHWIGGRKVALPPFDQFHMNTVEFAFPPLYWPSSVRGSPLPKSTTIYMLSTGAAAARSFYENVVALSLNLSDFKVWARFSELGFILRWVAVHSWFLGVQKYPIRSECTCQFGTEWALIWRITQ